MSHNWKVCEQESVHCPSSWKSRKAVRNNEAQTIQYHVDNKQSQCPSIDSKAVQTFDRLVKSPKVQYDIHRLNKFLKESANLVENEIIKSVNCWRKSSLWVNYWNDLEKNIKPLRKFTSDYLDQLLDKHKEVNKYYVSNVTWNTSQTYLAVGYSVKEHQDWCTHCSYLFMWNLYQRQQDDKKPEKVIEIEGCVSFIKAHPNQSHIYAIGTLSGKVVIVNIKYLESDKPEESYVQATSSAHFYFHQEKITGLEWLKTDKKHGLRNLISFGMDGKIIIWAQNKKDKSLEAVAVYIIYIRDLPKTLGVKNSSVTDTELAIISFSFDPEVESSFIVGCQGGAIFQCSIEDTERLKSLSNVNLSRVEPKSPIVLSYAPHRAHLNWVQFSLKLRKTFLSFAADNELRIYNSLQPKPLSIFHCDFKFASIQWLFKINGMIGVQDDGYLSVFSVTGDEHKIKQIHKFWLEDKKTSYKVVVNYFGKEDQVAVIAKPNEVHVLSLCYF
jgi:PREDICTED: predicted protein-like